MKKKLCFIIMLAMASVLLMSHPAGAHSGDTDETGCHICETNCEEWGLEDGEYHCHKPEISVSPPSFSDPLTIFVSFNTPGLSPFGLAYDGTDLWTLDAVEKKIYKMNADGNKIGDPLGYPGESPFGLAGLAYDGTDLWVSEIGNGRITEMGTSGNRIASFDFPGKTFAGLAYDGTYLWASEFGVQTIHKLDTSGNIIASFDSPGPNPTGLAYDGTYLWHTDPDTERIYKLSTSGDVILSFDALVEKPKGIAYDGEYLWVSDDENNQIYQLWLNPSVTDIGSSASRTFTVANSGDKPLAIERLSLGGGDPSDFIIENDDCSARTLEPSETGTFDVTFSPTSAGGKNASIDIVSDDPATPLLTLPLSMMGQGTGYLLPSDDLWIRAVINTEKKGPIEAVWEKRGEDRTEAGDKVTWGYFHADPDDVNWGSRQNPDLFVKIWFDRNGRLDVNFFHVSVPDIEVWSDYPYDGTPDTHGVTTLTRRYIRQYHEDGGHFMEARDEDGLPPDLEPPQGNPPGYYAMNDLHVSAVIQTRERGPLTARWSRGGEEMTADGHHVLWGHFYASPDEVTWGSPDNPDLFVKIWFDASGRVDVNFFHVSVPEIEVYSDFFGDEIYDEIGTTILDNRYIRHEFHVQN